MVKNLLLTTQLEANPILAKDEVNLKELLDEIIGDVWVLAKRIKFDVKAPADVKVTGDRDLLKQMLLNIVDNAIKFTPTNGTIRLILSKDNGWAVLEITDTGRGIPKEQLPHVMEAFYKADTSRRASNEGARLGLAIVKQIAELHGCNVEIESHEGIGTSVKVSLPIEGSKGVL
jgi:two-component system phosphate regulon sensor histidine kinase PhoR